LYRNSKKEQTDIEVIESADAIREYGWSAMPATSTPYYHIFHVVSTRAKYLKSTSTQKVKNLYSSGIFPSHKFAGMKFSRTILVTVYTDTRQAVPLIAIFAMEYNNAGKNISTQLIFRLINI
jgi:hypothetical protein